MPESMLDDLQIECRAVSRDKDLGLPWSIFLQPGTLRAAVERLYREEYFLEDVMATDLEEGYEVHYHFSHWDKPERIALRVLVPHDAPEVPSIADIYSGAEWHERETTDFFGVVFAGNPNDKPLLLDEEMRAMAPLRKGEKGRKSLLTFMDYCTIVDCAEDHPLCNLGKDDEGEAEAEAEDAGSGEGEESEES
jgi:NADH-quinone oxidoreductase subunit C